MLIALILLLCGASLQAKQVLILGDSVDRHIVEDWCMWANSSSFHTTIQKWGPPSLNYGGISSIISPSYCTNARGDHISSLHLFGSSAHGPYYSDKWEHDKWRENDRSPR